MEKKSFILYTDQKEIVNKLNNTQAGKLFKAILEYADNGAVPNFETILDIAFTLFKTSIDRSDEKWQDIKQKRSEAGRIGMQSRWGNKENITNDNKNITNDNKTLQDITDITVSGSVSGSVSDSVSVSVINNNARDTQTPTIDELRSYCFENEMEDFDYENFYNYYESNGWVNKNGSNIKNWKAKVNYWYKDDKENGRLVKKQDTSRRLG